MKIAIIGTGYVGLVSGTCFSQFGHNVTCIDKDKQKIEALKNGQIPIYEPGLEDLVKENVAAERLSFTTETAEAVKNANAVFIAVGTPTSRRGDGYADLSYVYAAAREIAPYLENYTVIVDKSTVPVGTAQQVKRIIREENPKAQFDVASNPEFLREGAAIDDFMQPDRVVIGVETEKAAEVLKQIYSPLGLTEASLVITNPETAELIKYASNAFLAVKISYINDMANLCEKAKADVVTLAEGMGLDSRIGSKFLQPGPGYGGSCFPKDTLALNKIAQEHGTTLRVVEAAIEVNSAQKAKMVKKIREALGGSESGKTISCLGLTFKPETDDMREAPSLSILPALSEKGAKVRAHDPHGMEAAKVLMSEIEYLDDPYEVCEGADCVVLMTGWNEYRALDLEKLASVMKDKLFIDLHNIYEPEILKEKGFKYFGVGRN
ncbi:MAG TPA: UDP-glucose/GDP-mannose dehydrogenase family protein [Candidatus Moranbacteria bacterium]|nr:UDP-glucose/GDP-mannose dehydrogenase family protein [Candidatus Moranbacteria bacterium]